MKLVLISDTHNHHAKLNMPRGDVLIHAGDATMNGSIHEIVEFAEWMGSLPYERKIFVPGNHDWLFQTQPYAAISEMERAGVRTLIDQSCMLPGGRTVYGSPWTPEFCGWAFMEPDKALAWKWGRIPTTTDVLITHGPPRGTLDDVGDGRHVGSETLQAEILDRLRPKLHVFGHIHEWGGVISKDSRTTYANAAVLDFAYNPLAIREPLVADL